MAKDKAPLADKAPGNETFLHRQDGGLGDELVKQQQKQQEAAGHGREIEEVTLKEIATQREVLHSGGVIT